MAFAPQLGNSSDNVINILWFYSNSPHKILKRLVELGLGYAKIMPVATTMIRRIIRAHLATRSAARKSFAAPRTSNDLFIRIFWIVNLFIFQILRHGSTLDGYHVATVNLHKNPPAIRFIKKLDANQSIKLRFDRLVMCPFFFNDTAINQFTGVLVDHFGGHLLAANLPLNFRSVVFVAHNRNTRAKAH
ncbi:hypothetical protein FBF26_03670 [Candidatus Saccharibacteria bacterium oral taxon 488]|nr:hypothetical protein FBF26_03670 [Candidatus Saccharibacteria bacterium oral taxon 488]